MTRQKRRRRPVEPLLWLLFSGGGVVAALLAPVLLVLLGLVFPLGWVDPLGVCALALAHWAHRFRYALYDGLQLKHWVINAACYGGALVGSALAAMVVLTV
jgi:fumarate reductase subunit D